MDYLLYIVICGFVAVTGFEFVLDWLNYKHLKKNGNVVPEPFQGIIDQSKLEDANRYSFTKMRFSFITGSIGVIETVLFFFGGLLAWYNGLLNSMDQPFIVTGIIFFLGLIYAKQMIDTPFSLYSTFRIEKLFGFNTMTPTLWIIDFVKGLLISAVLMSAVIAGALYICNSIRLWWLPVWGFFLVFSLLMMYIYPYVISPLFNKFVPITDTELESDIKATLAEAGITVSGVFTMDASKRTKHSNAYFTGIGSTKRIVLFDTLIESLTKEELIAVLAHEAGHCKHKHIIKNLCIVETILLVGAYTAFEVLQTSLLGDIFGIANPSFFTKLVLLQFVASIVMFPIGPLMHILSRKFEREADDFAVNLVGSGEPLAQALIKLSKDNLSNLYPHPLYATMNYSHPTAVERISYLKNRSSM